MAYGKKKDATGTDTETPAKAGKKSEGDRLTSLEFAVRRLMSFVEKFGATDIDKDGKIGSVRWAALGLLVVGMLIPIAMFAGEQIAVRYVAQEGDDMTIELAADEEDDTADEAQITMGANGLLDVSVGGTDIASIGTGLSALANANLNTANGVTLTANGIAATGVGGNYYVNDDNDAIKYTLPAVQAGMVVTFANSNVGASSLITVEIDAADKISLNGTLLDAGDTIDSPAAAGACITLLGVDGVRWITINRTGTWVDGGAT